MTSQLRPAPYCPCNIEVEGNLYVVDVGPCELRIMMPGEQAQCDSDVPDGVVLEPGQTIPVVLPPGIPPGGTDPNANVSLDDISLDDNPFDAPFVDFVESDDNQADPCIPANAIIR